MKLSGGYYLHGYRRLLRDLEPLLHLSEPVDLYVDMGDLSFMGPACMATTVAAISRAHDAGLILAGNIKSPRAPGINRYLQRMNFYDAVFHQKVIDDPQQRDAAADLVECTHFAPGTKLRGLTQDILNTVENKLGKERVARAALDASLSEILENVDFHADSPYGGVAAVQAFRNPRELELAVVDLGIGIVGSLAKNPDHEPYARMGDLAAVRHALTPNVTSTPERNRGWGLAFAELLLGLNGGHLVVRSGSGHVIRGAKVSDRTTSERLPSTLVAMRIKTDEPLDLKRAWSMLDEALSRVDLEEFYDDDVAAHRGSSEAG